jgi:8-oxo-dGTP pyrophosphatase MutT (NUDIX family)
MTHPDPHRPERTLGAPVVTPKPAATVVLLRPAEAGPGFEALLTRRPASMRFGGGIDVFPGGRLEPGDADAAAAAIRETREETGIDLEPDALVPLSRWVTPPGLPSRFDVRFFAAIVPAGTEPTAGSPEVEHARWMTPARALAGMRTRETAMWLPTIVTLQQLDGLVDRGAIEAAFSPRDHPLGAAPPPRFEAVGPVETLVTAPWAAGIEGRLAVTRLVGRRRIVVVDPADPTGETSAAIAAWAAARDATLAGVAVTSLDPVRHAGVEMLAAGMGLPVAAGPGAAALAPYPVTELVPGGPVPYTDVPLVAAEDRSGVRPEALAYRLAP